MVMQTIFKNETGGNIIIGGASGNDETSLADQFGNSIDEVNTVADTTLTDKVLASATKTAVNGQASNNTYFSDYAWQVGNPATDASAKISKSDLYTSIQIIHLSGQRLTTLT